MNNFFITEVDKGYIVENTDDENSTTHVFNTFSDAAHFLAGEFDEVLTVQQ